MVKRLGGAVASAIALCTLVTLTGCSDSTSGQPEAGQTPTAGQPPTAQPPTASAAAHRSGFDPPTVTGFPTGLSMCGYAYVVQAVGKQYTLGGCAGMLPDHPQTITLPKGSTFYVRVTHEEGGQLDFPVLSSASPAVRLVTRHGSVVEYRTTRVGTADLLARHTPFCIATDPKIATCDVLRVEVTAH